VGRDAPAGDRAAGQLEGAGRAELLAGASPVGGGSICDTYRSSWQGRDVFLKTHPDPPPGFFAAEEQGLRWLAETGAPVPAVLSADDELLVLEWVPPGRSSTAAAERLGRDLAALHRVEAPSFGAPWPGYIGSLPLDNATTFADPGDWPTFYAEQRVLPYLRQAADAGAVDASGRRAVEEVCERLDELAGPPEPPRRIHGDLWSGNVLWAADGRARLIDPAAHGGHRETDFAMLDLFGLPELATLRAAYEEVFPLAPGWQDRVGLHQLHPLLVHAALFGGGYGARVGSLAHRLLR
jgi:fructosamine-3-kinase